MQPLSTWIATMQYSVPRRSKESSFFDCKFQLVLAVLAFCHLKPRKESPAVRLGALSWPGRYSPTQPAPKSGVLACRLCRCLPRVLHAACVMLNLLFDDSSSSERAPLGTHSWPSVGTEGAPEMHFSRSASGKGEHQAHGDLVLDAVCRVIEIVANTANNA